MSPRSSSVSYHRWSPKIRPRLFWFWTLFWPYLTRDLDGPSTYAPKLQASDISDIYRRRRRRHLQHRVGTQVSGCLAARFPRTAAGEQDKLGGLITPR